MTANPKAQSTEPLEIKHGNVVLNIHKGRNRVGKATYDQYTLVYSMGGKRVKRRFADLEKAKREANLVAVKLENAELEVLKLSSQDRAIYIRATDLLRPLALPLNVAVEEYVSAIKMLPAGVTLREAIEFFLKRNPACMERRTVREVVDELLAVKTQAKRGELHLKDLESRLGCFGKAFEMNIGDITGEMIQKHLNGLGLSGRTQRNHLKHIVTLFKFAIRRKLLAKEALDELVSIEKPQEDSTEIGIFSPAELEQLFAAARSELVPWLAIGAFAGLRTAELQRLDWSEVNLAERHITVTAAKAKTASRRIVPITDNLAAGLTTYAQPSGKVAPFANMAKQIVWLVRDVNAQLKKDGKKADFQWQHNGLRHSFVSYRTAEVKDIAQVALECGNSPAMIFQHYKQLVTSAEAARWFAIEPPAEAKIIQMPKEVAAA